MADFRKMFLALAVVALLMGSAVTASAQAFQCTANAGVPPLVRAEGLTELVGDLLLNCQGEVPATGITANIRIFLNTNVTSKLLSGSGFGQQNEALLLLDEPVAGNHIPGTNAFLGTYTGVNTVDWLGVPIVPATGTTGYTTENKVIRITNIRANANQLGVTTSLIPTQIFEYISISGTTSVPVNNPQQVVAFIVPGLSISTSDADFKQCEENRDTIDVTFTEGFATSFKIQGDASQSTPGAVYNTETALVPDPVIPGVGTATQGTRFIIRFANVPSGVNLSSPTVIGDDSDEVELTKIDGTDSAGAGGSAATSSSIALTSGAGMVVYEVTVAKAAVIEHQTVSISVSYSGLPELGSGTMSANFAPTSTRVTAYTTSVAPIPRFVDTATSTTALTVSACRTVLLFPYVTNAAGFDTGIAISNTSKDNPVFDTDNQEGPCTLNYYGSIIATGGAAPAAQTSSSIAAGGQLVFSMMVGNAAQNIMPTVGFQGYIIAVCNFQYAHGYAFVSDTGLNLAQGYLALVIPDREDRAAEAPDTGNSNEGEQLNM